MAFQLIRIILLSTFAFMIALILSGPFLYFVRRFKLGKQIRTENAPIFSRLHKHKEGTPTMGGVIIWLAVLITIIVFSLIAYIFDHSFQMFNFLSRSETLLPLGALIASALVGLADDLLGVLHIGPNGGGLRIRDKLIVYGVIATIGAWWFVFKLNLSLVHIPFFNTIDLGMWPYFFFFIFVLVASTFAVNETDGLDGLSAGVLLPAFGSYGLISFMMGRYDLAALIGTIMGATLAFLWFNIHPAKFFMGDTGATSLGIFLGIVAMFTGQPLLLPLFGIILVAESLSVILQLFSRKLRNKKIFLSTPLHHHLQALGWPETLVTMRFWIISMFVSGLGLVIFFADRFRIFF